MIGRHDEVQASISSDISEPKKSYPYRLSALSQRVEIDRAPPMSRDSILQEYMRSSIRFNGYGYFEHIKHLLEDNNFARAKTLLGENYADAVLSIAIEPSQIPPYEPHIYIDCIQANCTERRTEIEVQHIAIRKKKDKIKIKDENLETSTADQSATAETETRICTLSSLDISIVAGNYDEWYDREADNFFESQENRALFESHFSQLVSSVIRHACDIALEISYSDLANLKLIPDANVSYNLVKLEDGSWYLEGINRIKLRHGLTGNSYYIGTAPIKISFEEEGPKIRNEILASNMLFTAFLEQGKIGLDRTDHNFGLDKIQAFAVIEERLHEIIAEYETRFPTVVNTIRENIQEIYRVYQNSDYPLSDFTTALQLEEELLKFEVARQEITEMLKTKIADVSDDSPELKAKLEILLSEVQKIYPFDDTPEQVFKITSLLQRIHTQLEGLLEGDGNTIVSRLSILHRSLNTFQLFDTFNKDLATLPLPRITSEDQQESTSQQEKVSKGKETLPQDTRADKVVDLNAAEILFRKHGLATPSAIQDQDHNQFSNLDQNAAYDLWETLKENQPSDTARKLENLDNMLKSILNLQKFIYYTEQSENYRSLLVRYSFSVQAKIAEILEAQKANEFSPEFYDSLLNMLFNLRGKINQSLYLEASTPSDEPQESILLDSLNTVLLSQHETATDFNNYAGLKNQVLAAMQGLPPSETSSQIDRNERGAIIIPSIFRWGDRFTAQELQVREQICGILKQEHRGLERMIEIDEVINKYKPSGFFGFFRKEAQKRYEQIGLQTRIICAFDEFASGRADEEKLYLILSTIAKLYPEHRESVNILCEQLKTEFTEVATHYELFTKHIKQLYDSMQSINPDRYSDDDDESNFSKTKSTTYNSEHTELVGLPQCLSARMASKESLPIQGAFFQCFSSTAHAEKMVSRTMSDAKAIAGSISSCVDEDTMKASMRSLVDKTFDLRVQSIELTR